jgi:hypothetical protein
MSADSPQTYIPQPLGAPLPQIVPSHEVVFGNTGTPAAGTGIDHRYALSFEVSDKFEAAPGNTQQ